MNIYFDGLILADGTALSGKDVEEVGRAIGVQRGREMYDYVREDLLDWLESDEINLPETLPDDVLFAIADKVGDISGEREQDIVTEVLKKEGII